MTEERPQSELQKQHAGLHKPIDEELTPEELLALRERIAKFCKMQEFPPMEDIQCLRVAESVSHQICLGMNSNHLDEFRILKYTNAMVLNIMNLKHGGRGVALQMFVDEAIRGAAGYFPEEDKTGDIGGAPSFWDWEHLKMPEYLPYMDTHKNPTPEVALMQRVKRAEDEVERLKAELSHLREAT